MMHDDTNNHDDHAGAIDALGREQLRMAAADGEPGAAERLAEMASGDAQAAGADHAAVQNQQALRHAVGRAMHASAPDSLRAGVLAALANAEVDGDTAHVHEAGRAEGQHRHTPGVLARIGRPLAVAAVVALGAVGVFQAVNTANPGGGQTASVIPMGQIQELSRYLTGRHDGARDGSIEGDALGPEDALNRVEQAVGPLSANLTVKIVNLAQAGYAFRVMKVCEVPNAVTSAHIELTPPEGAGPAETVSVFVQTRGGDAQPCLVKATENGNCYFCPEAKAAGQPFAFWRDDTFIVHVLSHSEDAFEAMMDALEAPSDRVELR